MINNFYQGDCLIVKRVIIDIILDHQKNDHYEYSF